jgi:hypothetical protein
MIDNGTSSGTPANRSIYILLADVIGEAYDSIWAIMLL